MPPLFLDQTEAQRAENIFFGDCPPPLSQGLDDPPSLSWSGSATVEAKEKKQSRTLEVKIIMKKIRRYNEETKFSVTPSFVLTHSSDSI